MVNRFLKNLRSYRREKIDPSSLQFRLTVGVASISLLGLGGMAAWTNWKMQNLVYSPHAIEIAELADTLPPDVQVKDDLEGDGADLQRLIDEWSVDGTWLWVRQPNGEVLAHSSTLPSWMMATTQISQSSVGEDGEPKIKTVDDHVVAICSQELTLNGQPFRVFLARDITSDYKMWLSFAQTLGLATAFTILGLSGVSAYLIRRSLNPLRKTCDQACANVDSQPEQSRLDPSQMPGEVKQLVQNWNRMVDQMSKTGEQQRLLTSGISHELRTPLSLVYGYLQSTLRRGNNLTPQQQEALKIAAAETEHTIKLLQDLLDLARVDCGTVQLKLEPISLNDAVTIMAETKGEIYDRNIEVKASQDPILVKADAHYLTEVIGHLIDNAIQFSSDFITVTLSQDDRWATLKMRDRGVGIPAEQLDQIFEPFYRVDPSRARSTGGVGLGLAIVKTLVSRMGGRISVTSTVGEGSTFEVQLPLARSAT